MFGLFTKRPKPDFEGIRRLLFGDAPVDEWRPHDGGSETAEPWSSIAAARTALQNGQTQSAIALLRNVAEVPELESRQALQVWFFLRQLGVNPPSDSAKRVRGVVLEVHLPDGLDTLAAYADHTARYINHGGNLIVWEAAESSVDVLIDSLLLAGQRIADAIGPWNEPRRGPPPTGHIRINMLTTSGLHFGEGPLTSLSTDPMGEPVIAAGTQLMRELIARATAKTV